MERAAHSPDWRLIHGVVFVLLMTGTFAVPAFRRWPWIWLAPLTSYFLLVALVPRLRRSLGWLRVGRMSAPAIAVTLAITALTALALVTFHLKMHPDVRGFRAAFPFEALGGVMTAGVVFAIVNATAEEFVFRGVLFDALQSQWGRWFTLGATAMLFGLGHLRGYPSGLPGACLAALFGFVMGALRLWTGGLTLPIVAHIGADATIYGLLVYSGAV